LENPEGDPLIWLSIMIANILTGNFPIGVFVGLFVIIVLLFFSAVISGSEIAFFSLNPSQIREIRAKEMKKNKTIISLLEIPKRLLATILISNNFVNVGIVIIGSYISSILFDFGQLPVLGFLVEVLVLTGIILMFGEILPKIFANQKPVEFVFFMCRPMKILVSIFYPLSSVLVKSTSLIDKKLANQSSDISMSDISDAIEIPADKETREEETKILKGIVRFSDIEVKEIMRSRMDVVAIDATTSFGELIRIVVDSGYSRIPVYNDTLDNIKGILYVKDLLPYLANTNDFEWNFLLRTAFFVPENKKINDLLQEIQEKKVHLAVVVDEYGGTSGIVTLEDIIEEIVGEITDELDTPEDAINFTKISDNTYIFEGKTSINDFCKVTGTADDAFDEIKGDADSLAGLILELLGEIPGRGEKVVYLNFEFIITIVDNRRIKQIKVIINDTINENEESD
jgi:gliding motility-associated protein GldE